MSVDEVRDAYGRRADEYAELFASMESTHELDRKLVSQWLGGITGRIIDAGCGPGQWTDFLNGLGCDVTLVLGMCEGPEVETFAHAVTTAYFWSIEAMSRCLTESGFQIETTETRTDEKRPHAAIVARRLA